eukprot:gnl/TRDRNA2_/TRDRNA2_214106_c0_seq1.p1 gnl/TRDRNA2_/TRDRNA2_214106_c0~~gnl/TRDRNA2_/TRDRNA2_214106_c0_seq1.p1  ORF type:complete len:224 (-),score=35.54 gnl/TRDRNA2_/TRDRNA2_214106_c0_seq1:186-857(-)
MQVPYEVRESPHGHGLFVTASVKSGELVWKFSEADASLFTEAQARAFLCDHPERVKQILEYGYWTPGADSHLIDLSLDDGRFFNHSSSQSNVALGSVVGASDIHSTYALRDIAADEELLDDYNTYGKEPEWYDKLLASNGIDTSYMGADAATESAMLSTSPISTPLSSPHRSSSPSNPVSEPSLVAACPVSPATPLSSPHCSSSPVHHQPRQRPVSHATVKAA